MPAEALVKLREKYPEYKDIPDPQLARQILDKYPAYQDLLGDVAAPKEMNLLEKGLNIASLPIRAGRQFMYGGVKDPETIAQEARQLTANTAAIPATMAGGAAVGGLSAAAKAPALVQAVAPAAGRVATEGALSRARGEDWLHTLLNMGGAIVGEGVMGGASQLTKKAAAPAVREGARVAEAARVGKAGGELFPELEAANDTELWGAAQQWGKKTVERSFQPTLNEIKARLKGVTGIPVPTLSSARVSFDDAISGLMEAGRETKGKIRQEIIQALDRITPGGGQLLDDALKARAAGFTYLTAIKRSLDPSGKLDPSKLAKFVNTNTEKLQQYAGKYWPQIQSALLGPGRQAPVDIPKKAETLRIMGRQLHMPESFSALAQKIQPVLSAPVTRAAVDVATGQSPGSALAVGSLGRLAKGLAHVTPGGSHVERAIESVLDEVPE